MQCANLYLSQASYYFFKKLSSSVKQHIREKMVSYYSSLPRLILNLFFLCELSSIVLVRAVPVPAPSGRSRSSSGRSGRTRRDLGSVRFRIKGLERGMLEGILLDFFLYEMKYIHSLTRDLSCPQKMVSVALPTKRIERLSTLQLPVFQRIHVKHSEQQSCPLRMN